ncbi:hypothetical protein M413DRAFT_11538 [Hebeloma cylindrosporum]|uniref:Enoyl reductase (ER) domain-containing protein n=1 Tax=Hebeloma cylindrosporum TaxID=76867 RepID=A0A0C3C916_HEBCY|nr:hypothetical protein M413DRAFT_11538 [Hebeloma cylindrosporum h7]
MAPSQKVLYLSKRFGDFVVEDAPIYKPGPGEILIKVQATSLNPVDWKIQKYGVFIEEFPAILGTDVAGDVEELGEGVKEFKKGDRVFVQGQFVNDRSSFQEYTLALASATARIPPNVSYDEAATLPVVLTAAYIGLYNKNPHGFGLSAPVSEATQGIYGGTPIVVLGGASSVGQIGRDLLQRSIPTTSLSSYLFPVIQLAKLSGFSPIITTASSKHADNLKSLGAKAVFDRDLSASDLAKEIKKLTNEPIKFVYDAVSSKATQETGIELLASGGQLAIVGPVSAEVDEGKSVVAVLGLSRLPHNIELVETLYHDKIAGFLEKGIIKPNKVEVLPNGLAGIRDGLKRMEENKISGSKLVARPQESL